MVDALKAELLSLNHVVRVNGLFRGVNRLFSIEGGAALAQPRGTCMVKHPRRVVEDEK